MVNSKEKIDAGTASNRSIADILDTFGTDPDQGLSASEVQQRQQRYGPNKLEEAKKRSTWQIFIAQFKSPIIALLAVAAVLAFAFQEWIEGIAVIITILLNTAIGFFTEVRAVRSMEALQELSRSTARVRRDGQIQEVPSEELVPGDIVPLEGGDLVPADLRLVEASKLQVDESPLTGESVPVSKNTEAIEGERPLAEQSNMLFKGTAITRGSGSGVVVAIGMETELGHISSLTAEAEEEITPLERRLDQLGRRLIWVTLAIAAIVAISGVLGGKDLFLMVETAIALSVAAVPEGLPIVATVALARGMWRMAQRNALINRLSAVETLGATSVICTDKTGTLTENRMTVSDIALQSERINVSGEGLDVEGRFMQKGDSQNGNSSQNGRSPQDGNSIDPSAHDSLCQILKVGVLCNNAVLPQQQDDEETIIGDPMEVALLVAGAKAGLDRDDLLQDYPEVREVAFESETKMMATIHRTDEGYWFAVKGATESVLPVCSRHLTSEGVQEMSNADRESWQEQANQMAEEGLRILAFAMKTVDDPDAEAYEQLTFLGLMGLLDPPRQEVRDAIAECHDAGIRVIMVTGDQAITAQNVGRAVGLIGEKESKVAQGKEIRHPDDLSREEYLQLQQVPIFSRVSPKQKLNLIAIHQQAGSIVAMTGDGVNDAPALKKADIGVAMGKRGTQVAREAADMVLQDDAFATIVAAVEQGRAIFQNIRKFTLYLLSGNVGEIIAVAAASLVGAPLPLLPLQILFLNAVNDVFPALALGVGEGNPILMEQPPRDSKEAILTRHHWWAIAGYGLLIAAPVLGIFAIALLVLEIEESRAVTISFLALAFGRLLHVFNMRDTGTHLIKNEVVMNKYIWGALVVCTGLLLSATYLPGLSDVLQTVDPGLTGWGLIFVGSLVPLIIGQLVKLVRSRRHRKPENAH